METHRFDNLARSYATSRRGLLKTLAGAALGGLLGGSLDHGAAASPACREAGHPCEGNQTCCAGLICVASGPGAALRCTPCPAGQIACGNACIPACTALDACHVAGVCDPASGACTNPPASQGTLCGQGPRCSDGVATGQDSCDGQGSCAAGPTTTCAPYVCGATSCLTACADDTACISGDYCSGGQCMPKLANGQTCASADSCVSGFCVDGVCCDSACTGQCEACNAGDSLGTCTAVTGAPVGGRSACASDGSICGGSCDGTDTQGCTYPGGGTSCRSATCSGGVETVAASCDGAGHCPAAATQSCGSYLCGMDACLTSCIDDSQCVATAYCDTSSTPGACTQDLVNGTACSRDHQCASGFCVDGVCCDTACTDQCHTCATGTCAAVTDGTTCDDGNACTTNDVCTGGVCGGTAVVCQPLDQCHVAGVCDPATGQCSNPPASAGTPCGGAAYCDVYRDVYYGQATCDAHGFCRTDIIGCTPYSCNAAGTACLTSCTQDTDCDVALKYYCQSGTCVPQILSGSCTAPDQCYYGHCEQGVCCQAEINAVCSDTFPCCPSSGHICGPFIDTPGLGICCLPAGTPIQCGAQIGECCSLTCANGACL